MKKVRILTILELTSNEQFFIFCAISSRQILESLEVFSKKNNCNHLLLITTKKEYKDEIVKQFKINNKISLRNIKFKIFYSQDDQNNYLLNKKIINFYRDNKYNVLIKIFGNQIINKNYFVDIFNLINSGNQIIFKNLIQIDYNNFAKNNCELIFSKNTKFEKLLYSYIKKNFKEILSLNSIIIKKRLNKFLISKNIPNFIALTGEINSKFIIQYNSKNFTNFIYTEKTFGKLCSIKLKSYSSENYAFRKSIIDKVIKELNKIPYKSLFPIFKKNNYLEIKKINREQSTKIKKNLKTNKLKSLNLSYYFDSIITKNYHDLRNFMTFHAFVNYTSDTNKKIIFFLVLFLSFLPFKLKWIFYRFLSYNSRDKFLNFLINKIIILPRKTIIKVIFNRR